MTILEHYEMLIKQGKQQRTKMQNLALMVSKEPHPQLLDELQESIQTYKKLKRDFEMLKSKSPEYKPDANHPVE